MYAALWRILPGPAWLRALILLVLAVAVIAALYLYVFRLPPAANAVILTVLAVLVFVPIRYVYPSRTKTLMVPTLVLGVIWGILTIAVVWRLPATDGPWAALSLVFPAYYTILSLYLHSRNKIV